MRGYYHVAAERGRANASVTTWDDVESNLRTYGGVFGFIAGDLYDPEALATLPDGRRRLLAAAFEAFR